MKTVNMSIAKNGKLDNFSRVESGYLKSLFEKGESYNEEEFIRRLRQGIREIGKYERGV